MTEMPTKEFTQKCKEAEFFETPEWAARRILDFELLTDRVFDPCAGRGVLGKALQDANYLVHEADLNAWPGAHNGILSGHDFLADWEEIAENWGHLIDDPDGFSVVMNPPFSKAVEFVTRALEMGARKVMMFQRLAFLESHARSEFFKELPPARIWLCGDRATCWRGDMPDEDILDADGEVLMKGKKGRSSPTPHAWFVWERGHNGIMAQHHLYKER